MLLKLEQLQKRSDEIHNCFTMGSIKGIFYMLSVKNAQVDIK